MEQRRLKYLDYARGFAMILVMYAHYFTVEESPLRLWIYSFHMPIFFIITGILICKKNSKLNIRKQFNSLIIPYFAFSSFNIVGLALLDVINDANWKHNILNNFKNTFLFLGVKATWFLPCLFIGIIFFHLLKDKIKKKDKLLLTILIIYLIPFLNINIQSIAGYKIICRSLIATVFLFIGYFLANKIDKIEINKRKILILFLFTLIYSYILGHVDLCYLKLGDPLFYLMSAIVGSIFVIFLFKYLEKKNIKFRLLEFIGKNSLIFLGTHMIIGYYVRKILSFMLNRNYITTNLYLNGFILLILCLIIEVISILFYNFIKKRVGGCICKKAK